MVFDTDKAASRVTRLWFRLGKAYEEAAHSLIERGGEKRAFECAKMADFCFWQATGENDTIGMKDISGQDEARQ